MKQTNLLFKVWNGEKISKPFTLNMIIDGGLILQDEDVFDLEEDKVMQYTGLKDKNGVEIYESDKFKTENGYVGEIIYEDGSFWSVLDGRQDMLIHAVQMGIEVIGNIYENPEMK